MDSITQSKKIDADANLRIAHVVAGTILIVAAMICITWIARTYILADKTVELEQVAKQEITCVTIPKTGAPRE